MKQIYKDGKWVEGKAEPKLRPEHMRKLPGKFITDDDAEGDKVHELDPPHIVEDLVDQQWLAEVEPSAGPSLKDQIDERVVDPDVYKPQPLTAELVDFVRMRIIYSLVNSAMSTMEKGKDFPLFIRRYVWFPENDIGNRQLREGNPPADSERPKHLKGYDLHIDVLNPPQRCIDILNQAGAAQYKNAFEFQEEIQKDVDTQRRFKKFGL